MARTGRPQRKVTAAERDQVMRLRADGWTIERIARLLRTDHETLAKHFGEELAHGADIKRNQLLEWAEKKAKKGSIGNIKWLHEQQARARAAERVGDDRPEPKAEKLGKKEELQRAAEGISGKFAPPAAPKVH